MDPQLMELLTEKAGEIDTEGTKFQESISKLDSIISILEQEWKGMAGQGFSEQFRDLKPHLDSVEQLFYDLGDQLNGVVGDNTELAESHAAKFRR